MKVIRRKDGTRRATAVLYVHIAEDAITFLQDRGMGRRAAFEWMAVNGPGTNDDDVLWMKPGDDSPIYADIGDEMEADGYERYEGPQDVIVTRTRSGRRSRR